MFLLPFCLLPVLLGLAAGLADFDDTHTFPGWQFIYHDAHKLLLTVTNNSCYYSDFDWRYADCVLTPEKRNKTEGLLHRVIMQEPRRAVPTTLSQLRDRFQDLLANFHCTHMHVYNVSLRGDDFIRAGIITSYNC